MPKAKTKSGAKKRFLVTGSGKIKHKKAFKRHILTKKTTKRKRALGVDGLVDASDLKSIRAQLLTYAK
jgi:large subunit ribosomal protein L35